MKSHDIDANPPGQNILAVQVVKLRPGHYRLIGKRLIGRSRGKDLERPVGTIEFQSSKMDAESFARRTASAWANSLGIEPHRVQIEVDGKVLRS